jgi:serine/threonine protein kinase
MGFNYSCNEAIKLSIGEYISFFNNDLILNKFVFKKIRQAFELNPNTAIVCPKTISKTSIVNQSKDSPIIVEEMGKREGWAWTARASFIKNINPIPSFLRTYYGDDYIFYCARLLKYNCLKITNNYIFHYRGETIKKTKGTGSVAMNIEKVSWLKYYPTIEKEIQEVNTNQSNIEFFDDYVVKTYKKNNINSYSSIDHELTCLNQFSCKYSPKILSVDKEKNSYTMYRYDVCMGNSKEVSESNIRRILFTISKEELFKQLDEILQSLKEINFNHRDINPGNLLFSEKEKTLKLIDFYWTNTSDVQLKNPKGGINQRYGTNDEIAIKKIKEEIDKIFCQIKKSMKNVKKIILKFGVTYNLGSSKHVGKSYSRIDIPYLTSIPFHRDIEYEYKEIRSNLSIKPKTFLDIGCSTGFTTFNLFRDFSIIKGIGYEADPLVYEFLKNIQRIFCLNNLDFIHGVTPQTIFPKIDVVICMNVHMWLHKRYGNDECNLIIKKLIESSKEMFFQTAGSESHGMYLVKDLTSKEVIQNYLISLSPKTKEVKFIRSTKYHGGLRHLFKINGE